MTEHHEPCSCQEQDSKRRDFLKGMFFTIGGFITFSMAWPFISFLIPSEQKGPDYIKVPNFKDIPEGKPSRLFMSYVDKQAFIKTNVINELWVIKHSADKATVYSPLCPHLNCHYTWESTEFKCPCHNSIFDATGKVLSGPSPRALDTLPNKIEGGELFVKWEQYKPGVAGKVEA